MEIDPCIYGAFESLVDCRKISELDYSITGLTWLDYQRINAGNGFKQILFWVRQCKHSVSLTKWKRFSGNSTGIFVYTCIFFNERKSTEKKWWIHIYTNKCSHSMAMRRAIGPYQTFHTRGVNVQRTCPLPSCIAARPTPFCKCFLPLFN